MILLAGIHGKSSSSWIELYLQSLTSHSGTGRTLQYSCYGNNTDRKLAKADLHGVIANASDVALGQAWAEGKVLSDTCMQQMNETGNLVGTTFTVKDMFQIVDNIGEDGKLRYWGTSLL
jgi:hypothetical protein